MDDGDGGWDLLGALFYLFFTDAVILHRDAGDEVPLSHLLVSLLVQLLLLARAASASSCTLGTAAGAAVTSSTNTRGPL